MKPVFKVLLPTCTTNNNYEDFDLAKMNPAFSTALQTWSRSRLLSVVATLLLLHVAAFFLGVLVAPTMFHDSEVPGTVCRKELEDNSWYDGTDHTRCMPMQQPKVDSLRDSLLAFRFPSDQTQPSSYDRWNWKLLGSLYLGLSFIEDTQESNVTFAVNRRNVPLTMEAKLDASHNSLEGYDWTRQASLKAERKLQCTVTSMQNPNSDDGSSMTSIDYACTLTPLFSLELLSNQSYILQLSFSPQSSNKSYDLFGLTTRTVTVQKAALTLVIESSAFHSAIFYLKCFCLPFVLGALVIFSIRLYLNDLYVSIPDRLLITCALAQTLHNIPVEALIAEGNFWPASPYMKLIDELGRFVLITCLFIFWVVYTKDKVSPKEPWERNTRYYWRQIVIIILGGLIAGLWVVYSRGPTLRNAFTNHWMVDTPTVMVSLGLIFSLAALVLMYQTYLSVLVFRALCDISVVHYRQHYCSASGRSYVPHRIWRIKMVLLYSFAVSILTIGGLILQLAMELSLHWNPQFYLNPIPFHLTFASAYILGLNGLWNLYIVALLLMLSRSTNKDSNEDYVMPVTYYSSQEENESSHHRLNGNGGAASPNECVLDSLTSNHFSSDGSSNLKMRRQSSEDFLELERAREYCRHHCGSSRQYYNNGHHRYEDFSASSPDYEYEGEVAEEGNEAMVDEDDPLEMARQGTVHLWEQNSEVGSSSPSRAFCNFSDDAFINSNSHSAANAFVAFTATSESDDAVLYTHNDDNLVT